MNILILNTSFQDLTISALVNGKNFASSATFPANSHSTHTLREILHLLFEAGITIKNLDFIAVGTGPGSFTGTRIGVVIAKCLNFTHSIPLVPFNSHLMLIPTHQLKSDRLWVVTDARSNQHYATAFKIEGKLLIAEPTQLIKTSQLEAHISSSQSIFTNDSALCTNSTAMIKMCSPNTQYVAILTKHLYLTGGGVNHRKIDVNYYKPLSVQL